MKAQNNREINIKYLHFTLYLIACIIIAVISVFMNRVLSTVELSKVIVKTSEYDNIYRQQIGFIDRIDSLYVFSTLFEDDKTDKKLLEDIISSHKQAILSSVGDLEDPDVKLYKLLLFKVNGFLSIKDSIRTVAQQEEMVRNDLIRCIDKNNRNSADILNITGN